MTYLEKAEPSSFDIVIVDPPRQGLAKAVSGSFRLPRKKLILISCDPVSFARELANYRDAHFTLESCHLFDMFPQTHHIESMAVLLPPA